MNENTDDDASSTQMNGSTLADASTLNQDLNIPLVTFPGPSQTLQVHSRSRGKLRK